MNTKIVLVVAVSLAVAGVAGFIVFNGLSNDQEDNVVSFEYDGLSYVVLDKQSSTSISKSISLGMTSAGVEKKMLGDGYVSTIPVALTGQTRQSDVVTIPSIIVLDGKKYEVQELHKNAFVNSSVKTITIPETITLIEPGTFNNCDQIECVNFNAENCKSLTGQAFTGSKNHNGVDVVTGEGVKTIPSNLFSEMQINTLTLSTTVSLIQEEAFASATLNNVIVKGNNLVVVEDDTLSSLGDEIKFEDGGQFVDKKSYRITFDNGTDKQTVVLEEGAIISKPLDPTKQSDPQYDYVFDRWDGYTENMTATGDVTFTAVYSTSVRSYPVCFVSEGSTVSSSVLPYGTAITAPNSNPSKGSTAQYDYAFAGWDGYVENMTVTGEVTFTAVFTPSLRSYTVCFVSEGIPVSSSVLPYGTIITVPVQDPSRESTVQYDYAFAGWDGYISTIEASGMTAKWRLLLGKRPSMGMVSVRYFFV